MQIGQFNILPAEALKLLQKIQKKQHLTQYLADNQYIVNLPV